LILILIPVGVSNKAASNSNGSWERHTTNTNPSVNTQAGIGFKATLTIRKIQNEITMNTTVVKLKRSYVTLP
jgi:hypothetical protein